MKLITTSWDDGHPADLRLAELLKKYSLKATFYLPKHNAENDVMSEPQMKELAGEFEIGGHTLRHERLKGAPQGKLEEEIGGSFRWLSDLLGKEPVSFCFPGGAYDAQGLAAAYRCGYTLVRNTVLHSVDLGWKDGTVPTTVQAFEHSRLTHAKHFLKRRRGSELLQWLANNRSADLLRNADYHLQKIEQRGGCFHLWGHSWEIQKYNLWQKLDGLFALLAHCQSFRYIENKDLLFASKTHPAKQNEHPYHYG